MADFIKHITEDQSDSRKNGDVQYHEARDTEKSKEVEITGNQSKEYYNV